MGRKTIVELIKDEDVRDELEQLVQLVVAVTDEEDWDKTLTEDDTARVALLERLDALLAFDYGTDETKERE